MQPNRLLICLSQTRLSSWYVTPFLDNWFLGLSWVGSGTRTYFFWDINAFFSWLKKRNQFGDVLTDSLGFQVTSFFLAGNLSGTWSTNFSGNLLTFGFWAVFLYLSSAGLTLLDWPFGTFLFSGVTLGDIFTLFFLDSFTLNYVILDIVFSVTSSTSGFVDGLTYFFTITFQKDWGVTEGNSFFGSDLLVFDETALNEVFFTVFFLLWFEVSSVGGVTFFTVAVFAGYSIIVFGFFNHDDFVDTSFSSSSNGSNGG